MKKLNLIVVLVTLIVVKSNAQSNAPTLNLSPFENITSFIAANGELLPVGLGVNLHGKLGESLAQQLDVLGGGGTNLWRVGVVHETVFLSGVNQEELGIGATYEWRKMPSFTKHFLLFTTIPKEVKFGISVAEPVELYSHGPKDYDWKETTLSIVAGWQF